MTLTLTFRVPFFREWLLAHGLVSCGRKTCVIKHVVTSCHIWTCRCNAVLTSADKGKGIMLVVGGAAESLDARPGNLDLVLKGRKGFVKVKASQQPAADGHHRACLGGDRQRSQSSACVGVGGEWQPGTWWC